MAIEVVTVQRPLNGDAPWMVYAEGRRHMMMIPADQVQPALAQAMGSDMKAYFEAEWFQALGWEIGKRVDAREW